MVVKDSVWNHLGRESVRGFPNRICPWAYLQESVDYISGGEKAQPEVEAAFPGSGSSLPKEGEHELSAGVCAFSL